MIGTARTAPTAPFTSNESLNRKARRECFALRTLSGSSLTICSFCGFCSIGFIVSAPRSLGLASRIDSWLHGIWLPGICAAFGCEPRDNICNLLVCHWLSGVCAPVRHSLLRLAGDNHAAQALIADQSKVRSINQRADLPCTALVVS